MKDLGTLIQALLLAGAVTYFLPYLIGGVRETIQELKQEREGKR